MKLKIVLILFALLLASKNQAQVVKKNTKNFSQTENNKIKVLNIGVFHMGQTSDASSTEYNEASTKAKQEIKEVNQAIAQFKPTIILIEAQPKYQQKLNHAYKKYLQNTEAKTGYENNEIQLLGFEIGRLSNVKKIVGIDHRMSYDYDMQIVAEKIKAKKYFETGKKLQALISTIDQNVEKVGLKNSLLTLNTDEAYNFLININADMLMFANSKNSFEGADEAAKFYHRNIRMFANINKIKTNKNDRILIISGATHAAFFNKFIKRSMVYDLVSLSDYLN